MLAKLFAAVVTMSLCAQAHAEVAVKHEGLRTSWTFKRGAAQLTPDSSRALRTYVLVGQGKQIPRGTSCVSAFSSFDKTVLSELAADHIDFIGVVGCMENRAREAEWIDFNIVLEPDTQEYLPQFHRYLRAHQGQPMFGTTLDYQRVFGLLMDANIMCYSISRSGSSSQVGGFDMKQMFLNQHDYNAWVSGATTAFALPKIEDFLAWVNSRYPAGAVDYLKMLLPKSNYVMLWPDATIVMDDRTTTALPLEFVPTRDCQATGHCL